MHDMVAPLEQIFMLEHVSQRRLAFHMVQQAYLLAMMS